MYVPFSTSRNKEEGIVKSARRVRESRRKERELVRDHRRRKRQAIPGLKIVIVFLIPRFDRRRYPNLESHWPIDSSITQLPAGLSSSLALSVIAFLAP
jgi:hypothetical protein